MKVRALPPMLTDVVRAAFMVCDQTEYFTRGRCCFCGGSLSGYDTRTKRFAILCDEEGEHPVEVVIHRAYCRECGRILVPEEPFYTGTRVGSPVIDLCQTLASSVSNGHVTGILGRLGVKVSRWSVHSYCHFPIPPPPAISVFGLQLPASVIALSSLAGELGNNRSAAGDAVLAACNFPSRYTRMGGISIAACALAAFFSYDSILLDIIAV